MESAETRVTSAFYNRFFGCSGRMARAASNTCRIKNVRRCERRTQTPNYHFAILQQRPQLAKKKRYSSLEKMATLGCGFAVGKS
jgi:hypothetical protein